MVIATLATQILLQLNLVMHVIDTVSQCLQQDTVWRLFVWTAGDVLLVFGMLLFAFDAFALYLIGLAGRFFFAISGFISFIIVLVSSMCWGSFGWFNAHYFPTDLRIRRPSLKKTRYFILYFGYVMFTNIVARSAIPTLLLAIVFPVESISAIGLMCFECLAFIMLCLPCRSQTLMGCFFGFHMLILLTVISCVVGVYVSILFTGPGTSEYLQTFLPSLGTAVVGYLIKKFLEKNKMN